MALEILAYKCRKCGQLHYPLRMVCKKCGKNEPHEFDTVPLPKNGTLLTFTTVHNLPPDFNVAKLYGMLPASTSGDSLPRTPADNQTVRNVFVIGPDKKVKLILVYPMTPGRNFDEVLRVIDSLQLTAKHRVATPAQWQQGDDVIIAGSVSNDEAKEIFGQWEEPRPYIRIVPQPQ